MTTLTHTTAPFGAITIYRTVAKAAALRTAFNNWRKIRNTRNELYSLSDDVLRDIGISRWEIDACIR